MRFQVRAYAYLLAAVVMAVSAVGLSATQAFAQKRFAFVIGNGAYANVAKLPNALNDAGATRTMLQDAGFDITPAMDLSLAGLRSALDVFVDKVRQGGPDTTALIYYAGHAVQLDGANYILPTDVRPETSANIPNQALSLSEILRRLDSAGVKAKIAILDACRDNPFAGRELSRGLALQIVDGANEGIRSEAGLARIDSGSGTFVAFATSPGSTAADGTGVNSPFTTAFLREAREPGLPVEQIFRRIRLSVYDSTNGVQIPWDTSSLITEFAFFPRQAGAAPAQPAMAGNVPMTARPTQAALRAMSPADATRTAIAWDRQDIYGTVLSANLDDQSALRLQRILSLRTEERAWAETVLAGDAESFKLYARLYPVSSHVAAAVRLAATAPSRNRLQVAQTCPVCPALPSQPRARRADYTPRGVSPARNIPRQAPAAPAYVPPAPQAAPREAAVFPVVEPLLPQPPRWTRFYAGIHGGGGDLRAPTRVQGYGPLNEVQTSIAAGNVAPRLSPSGNGGLFGGQLGFSYQMGAFVLGAETDLAATDFGARKSSTVNPFGVQVTTQAQSDLSMLGTVRARAGVAFGDLLVFGTGGFAYGRAETKGAILPDPNTNPTYIGSHSQLATGWALGGGVEYAFGPMVSVKLDYLHYDLGNRQLTMSETTGAFPSEYATMRARTNGNLVRAGLNLGF